MTAAVRPTLDELTRLADAARDGETPQLDDPAVADAVDIAGAALGTLSLDVAKAAGAISFRGWFTREAAVMAAGAAGDEAAPVRLATLPVPGLAQRIARLVDLGPRPAAVAHGELMLPHETFKRLVAGELAGDAERVAALLGAPEGALEGWADALASDELTRWRLAVEGVGAQADAIPRMEVELLDAPGAALWQVVDDGERGVALLSTTPRLAWIALTALLPCWDASA